MSKDFLSPQAERLVRFLLKKAIATRSEIAEELWGDRQDGGPISAENIISGTIKQARVVLEAAGSEIITRRNDGYYIPMMKKPQAEIALAVSDANAKRFHREKGRRRAERREARRQMAQP